MLPLTTESQYSVLRLGKKFKRHHPDTRSLLQVGTPLCVPSQGGIDIGRIASMELNHKPVNTAKQGESVAMKIEPGNATEATRLYGRHFDFKVPFYQP